MCVCLSIGWDRTLLLNKRTPNRLYHVTESVIFGINEKKNDANLIYRCSAKNIFNHFIRSRSIIDET